jgi:hypothetical protein
MLVTMPSSLDDLAIFDAASVRDLGLIHIGPNGRSPVVQRSNFCFLVNLCSKLCGIEQLRTQVDGLTQERRDFGRRRSTVARPPPERITGVASPAAP